MGVGDHALERLRELQRRNPLVGDARGLGLVMGIELVADPETKEPAVDATEQVLYECLDRGLSFKTTMGNVITLTPPLVTTVQDMDWALTILEGAIANAARDWVGHAG